MSFSFVPPTANLHLVPYCNYACRFCYATFSALRPRDRLSSSDLDAVLAELARHGVRKVTLAGGEPTLAKDLHDALERVANAGLVPSIVTNARLIDPKWFAVHGPWLRWLAVSCDSVDEDVSSKIGRRLKSGPADHVAHVRKVFRWAHAWNAARPAERRLGLKLNMVVTALNAGEDPRSFIRECAPDRVKLLQLLPVAGENDHAADLHCPPQAFLDFANRVASVGQEGIEVVAETSDDMDGSYLMIDPLGRVFQRKDGRYVTSRPIAEVGLLAALADVGGVVQGRFVDRGGDYEPGTVPMGNLPYLIAVEGLDGSGKSTVARALAERIGAEVVTNPPAGWQAERTAADRASEAARRAFYLRGNRAALDLANEHRAQGRPVIMDRSFASTLAFGEATAGRVADPAGWPADLERPDLLVLLDVPEDARGRRLATRSNQTDEERRLAQDDAFRGRVLAGYRALGAVPVDASRPVEEVVGEIVGVVGRGRALWPGRSERCAPILSTITSTRPDLHVQRAARTGHSSHGE